MAEFHFLRPFWLLLLVLAPPLLIWLWRRQSQRQVGQGWLAAHLAPVLVQQKGVTSPGRQVTLVGLALTIVTLALAGPAWERLPQPVYQLEAGQVIIVDMSLSTRATDVTPNRLSQIRFKALDIVRAHQDGEIGLVAYAGDAFTISPLTTDRNNLMSLLPSLSPEIMPEQGSYPQRALAMADEMLNNAGYEKGDIYWLTDGIETRDQNELTEQLRASNHRVSVLAVGTEAGAPIRLTDGTLLREANGKVVVPKLYTDRLAALAELTNGRFIELTADNRDVDYLTSQAPLSRAGMDSEDDDLQQGSQWIDRGPWLALLLLPLALLPWRRGGWLGSALLGGSVGYLLTGLLLAGLVLAPGQTLAQSRTDESTAGEPTPNTWWETAEQQAQKALTAGDYDRAAALTQNPLRRGEANYRAERYEEALADFQQVAGADGHYNQGNTLMQLEDFAGAAEAYEAALDERPDWQAARDNLALAQQRQQEQEQQNSESSETEEQQEQNQQGQNGESGESGDQSQDGEGDTEQAGDQQPSDELPGDMENEGEGDTENDAEDREEEQQESTEGEPEPTDETNAEAEARRAEIGEEGVQLDPEQQREFEQMMRRLPDDPAFLLQQKMRIEAQKRQQQRPPRGVQREW